MKDIKPKIKKILYRKVSRKEFLKLLGSASIGLIGINNLTKLADKPTREDEVSYGDSSYGI